jgi:Skp family chaperone for outer membrane proteins
MFSDVRRPKMKIFKRIFQTVASVSIICYLSTALVCAIEIPIDSRVVSSGENKDTSNKNAPEGIAYVDIEMIFNEHPMTVRLKTEFEAAVAAKKKELSNMDNQMADMRRVIVSTTTEIDKLKGHIELMKKALNEKPPEPRQVLLPGTSNVVMVAPQASTSTVKADPELIVSEEKQIVEMQTAVEKVKTEISKLKLDIDNAKKRTKEDIIKLEADNTKAVLNDIYKMLEKIAGEDNLTIVVDKNNVLYGRASQDLTDKLRERMRGR